MPDIVMKITNCNKSMRLYKPLSYKEWVESHKRKHRLFESKPSLEILELYNKSIVIFEKKQTRMIRQFMREK